MRLSVQKTLKMYSGGAFIRSESGRVLPHKTAQGIIMNVPRASRKDLRNVLEKARGAAAGWSGRTAYNRGQILYRLGEMLEGREAALPTSKKDVQGAIDRVVHHAGWTDKITALLSSLNPVGMAYVNYSQVRPLGIVVAFPDPEDGLVGMVEAICVSLVMGNPVTLIVPVETAELAAALSECLATSDVPASVVNILMGNLSEVLEVANIHDDLDGLYIARGAISAQEMTDSELKAARVMRRFLVVKSGQVPARPDQMAKLAEIQTVWMSSMGNMPASSAGY